jgi:phosphoglucomutase
MGVLAKFVSKPYWSIKMDQNILDRANGWKNNSFLDTEHRDEIQSLIESNNETELTERFYKDLEFGTGGLRSIAGIGTNRINKYTVRRATQAMAEMVKKHNSDKSSVAISYDSRRFSFEFSREAASVLAANGIKVWIYRRLNPVPMLSYAVRELGCAAGIMITASHNPPEYNGFKAYGPDGGQLIPPLDSEVINNYKNIEDYAAIPFMDFEEGLKSEAIQFIPDEVEQKFYDIIKEYSVDQDFCQKEGKDLSVVYTAIHGTGHRPCTTVLNQLGFTNTYSVEQQKEPNGDFPTVTSPNPENPEAMDLAVKYMQENNCDIVFGSDPDTDRLGVAFMKDGNVAYLNGNQIGTLMLDYIIRRRKELGTLKDKSFIVNTVVTSPLQNKIAEENGLASYKTLTGFKWICGKVNNLLAEDNTQNFLFGTEESFGYLTHPYIRDKDGVGSVAMMAEVALYYKKQGIDLLTAMDKIYEQYGFSQETLINKVYEGCSNYGIIP